MGSVVNKNDWDESFIFTGYVEYTLKNNSNNNNDSEEGSFFKLGWKMYDRKSMTEFTSSDEISIEFHELEDHKLPKASILFEIRENIKGLYVFSNEKLSNLVRLTNFDKFEVRDLYLSFCKICNTVSLDYNQFCYVFNEISNNILIPSLYNAFGNGDIIDFEQFLKVLSDICRGPVHEKAIFLAKLFDPKQEGWIHKDNLFDMLNSISNLMKMLGFDEKDYGDPEELVNSIFSDTEAPIIYFDEDGGVCHENQISTSQFIEKCIHEPNLIECFGFFDYIYQKFVSPTESRCRIKQIEMKKEICGWLEKDKGESFLNWTFQFVTSRDKRWFLIKDGFMAYSKKPFGNFISVMPLWDAIVKSSSSNPRQFHLDTTFFSRSLYASTSLEAKIWTDFIRASSEVIHRYRSFAPIRTNITSKWIVNGKDYFREVYDVIERTKYRLFISGWYLSPGLYLIRENGIYEKYRLDNVLVNAAKRGVLIYILIWNAPSVSFDLKSSMICSYLNSKHDNIYCLCIPNTTFPMLWAHHQKMLVSDDNIAFIGGIDICFGRYDDDRFLITDPDGSVFPGMDYTNLYKRDEVNSIMERPWLERCTEWRLPWHDIQCRVNGLAAKDISINFIQIWNKSLKDYNSSKSKFHYLFPLTLITRPNRNIEFLNNSHQEKKVGHLSTTFEESVELRGTEELRDLNPNIFEVRVDNNENNETNEEGLYLNCKCQVLRSSSQWNTGLSRPEQSIYKAYIHLIQTSKHYIYIQNQYFISSISRSSPKNRILEAIYRRICKAIDNNEKFRCIIVVPHFPGGRVTHGYVKYVMHCTYKTISRGKKSILSLLSEKYQDVDISNYITFHTLRQIGELYPNIIAESIYVHCKLLIVDDRSVIIGSSNINDRSMRGTRDSEIAILIEGSEETVDSLMDNKPFIASKFAYDLRIRLWSMFLGIKEREELEQISDPICDETYISIFKRTSNMNSKLYKEIFPSLPENTYKLSDLKDMVINLEELDEVSREAVMEKVKKIKGHYINFPHDYLKNENMSIGIFDKEFVLPKYTFH